MATGTDDMSAPEHSNTLPDLSRPEALLALSKCAIARHARTAIVMHWLTTFLLFASITGSLYMQVLAVLVVGHIVAAIKHRFIDGYHVLGRVLRTECLRPPKADSRHEPDDDQAQPRRRTCPASSRRHPQPSTRYRRERGTRTRRRTAQSITKEPLAKSGCAVLRRASAPDNPKSSA